MSKTGRRRWSGLRVATPRAGMTSSLKRCARRERRSGSGRGGRSAAGGAASGSRCGRAVDESGRVGNGSRRRRARLKRDWVLVREATGGRASRLQREGEEGGQLRCAEGRVLVERTCVKLVQFIYDSDPPLCVVLEPAGAPGRRSAGRAAPRRARSKTGGGASSRLSGLLVERVLCRLWSAIFESSWCTLSGCRRGGGPHGTKRLMRAGGERGRLLGRDARRRGRVLTCRE